MGIHLVITGQYVLLVYQDRVSAGDRARRAARSSRRTENGRPTMRPSKLFILLAALGAALLLGAGTALAQDIACPGFTCLGTAGEDTLRGTADYDGIVGNGGADTIYGYAGNDALYGDYQINTTLDGSDRVYGGEGDDGLMGHGGADLLVGGPGADTIDAEEHTELGRPPGTDTVKGGRGRDTIDAADGYKDVIDCGPGVDQVSFDKGLDTLVDCENRNPVPVP